MVPIEGELIDWAVYTATRSALGDNFVRILGYFREDGAKSVMQIEQAMRAQDAAQMIMPGHTLKGEASQFGAIRLGIAAEQIELTARKCIEHHQAPDELLELVVQLRPMFEETLVELTRETSPVVERQVAGFGRKSSGLRPPSPLR